MKITEPLQYLPQRGISPLSRIECSMPGCEEKFLIVHGFAFPGTSNGGETVEMFFFHSLACYLEGIPVGACASA